MTVNAHNCISLQIVIVISALLVVSSCAKQETINEAYIKNQIRFIEKQHESMLYILDSIGFEPRSIHSDKTLIPVGIGSWTSGYFTASLWLLYEATNDEKWKIRAKEKSVYLANTKSKGELAIGFITCMQNAWRVTDDTVFRNALIRSANDLKGKYNPDVGMIRVWDGREQWNFPVIVDYLSNLQPLYFAASEMGDSSYHHVAENFVKKSLKYHIRDDNSTNQVAEFDSISGKFLGRKTYQGLDHTSTWSRGQAWAIDGLSEIADITGNTKYLNAAKGVSDFFIEKLPPDGIPYWDFNDPHIPNTFRDASAAALACTGLIEMYRLTKDEKYKITAENILISLSSEKYVNHEDELPPFLLLHSVGNFPSKKEVDVPVVYADYYYVEALVKYKNHVLQ